MLCASALQGDRALENFVLFLKLKASEQQTTDHLRQRFFKALCDSAQILKNPAKISASTTTETVSLAANMKRDPILQDVLLELATSQTVSKEAAQSALNRMEISYADGGQSPNFGETVFSVI
jgi:hypothetical protein